MAWLRRGGAGFTVIEMMIAMTITLVAMAIATELILESQRRLAHSGRRNLDMSVDLAFDQLRLDVRSSTGFDIPPGMGGLYNDGSTTSLVIEGHYSGDTIAYELVDGDLRRLVYKGTDFNPASQRVVLKQVGVFRWRNHPQVGQMLEVLISHEETAEMTGLVAGGQRERLEPAVRTVSMMLKPRDVLLGKTTW